MPRISPLIRAFLACLEVERGLSANTIKSYSSDLLNLQRWTSQNQLSLRGLTHHDIDHYVGYLSRTTLNASSIDRAISAIRGLFQFLFREHEIPADPTMDLASLKKTRPLPQILTTEDVRRLLNGPDESTLDGLRDRALLEILFAAGLRLSEAIKLRLCDVSIERRILRCLGKGNKERQVPFSQSAADSLARYIRAEHPVARNLSSIIFLNQRQPLNRQFGWALVKRYAAQAAIPQIKPHTLRHTFATSLLNRGMPTRIVQELLGHASVSTTEIYLSVSIARIRETYDQYHPRASSAATEPNNNRPA